jgi:retron-type reverse transcriptase
MKRHGNLFDTVVSWNNLWRACRQASLGKRFRPGVARFVLDQERELLELRRDLLDGSYRPGTYFTFTIRDPKERLISVAPFRDRVVHHAVCAVLEPLLDRTLIADTFANRLGKGTHRALDRFQDLVRKHRWVVVGDVRKYFASIDHGILKDLLRHKLKDRRLLALLDVIVDGSNPQEEVIDHFPGDDLFTPLDRRKGLPIGNLTSQVFANLYLSPFDHWVREHLRVSGYVRYMDDFALFGDDRALAREWRDGVVRFLEGLRLKVHDRKTRLRRTGEGLPFLGFVVFRDRRRLRGEAVRRFVDRCGRMAAGRLPGIDIGRSVAAWAEHASHGDTWPLVADLLGRRLRWPVRTES